MPTPLIPRLLDLAVSIQQIPAPTFQEARRAEFVRACLQAEGLAEVGIDPAGNVLACLKASNRPSSVVHHPLLVSAHMDTVFPDSVDLRLERRGERLLGPGIGDNALGVAALFALVWELRERCIELPADLWLAANVGEEGLGDLCGIRAVVERFGSEPVAYIILEGMSLGKVYHRALGVRRYRLTVRTAGGHSWIDYGRPSAIHELAGLATRLTRIEMPRSPRSALNLGVISGGSSVNTIAAEAMLELDLRSEGPEVLEELAGQVQSIAASTPKAGVTIDLQVIGRRPSGELPPGHPLVRLACDSLRAVGIEPRLSIGSTDANLPLSLGLPAVTIGLTTGGGAHTVHEYIDIAPLEKGVEQVVRLVERAWG
jgi:acetylornithine deacetylase/succinyl-diaminopimelate desuccinylase-like protein